MENNAIKVLPISLVFIWISACTILHSPVATTSTATKMIFTETAVPTSIATIRASTQTLVPTLTSEDATIVIERLLSGEKSCPFPCWWDFIPGQTQISDVRSLMGSLSVFSVGTPKLDSDDGYLRLIVPHHQDSYVHLTLAYKGQDDILELLWLRIQSVTEVTDADGRSNYEVVWDNPFLTKLMKPYSLSQVLLTHGVPSEVLIRTYQTAPINRPWPISLVIYYPEKGFMIEYVADGKGVPNGNIGWCPSSVFPSFWFWTPSNEVTLSNIISKIPGEELAGESLESFKTIEEATGLSMEEFYILFKANENKCVETPVNIWPMPGQ